MTDEVLTNLVRVRTETEVLDCFTVTLGATKENDIRAGGSAHRKLIECDTLAARLLNASTSCPSEAKRAEGHLWYF